MNFYKCVLLVFIVTLNQLALSKDWQFNDMTLSSFNKGFKLNYSSIRTPFAAKLLSKIEFTCSTSQHIYPLLDCKKGTLSFKYQQNQYHFLLKGQINLSNNTWDITLSNAQQNIQLISQSQKPDILMVKLQDMPSDQLATLIQPYVDVDFNSVSANISAQIEMDFSKNLTVDAAYQIQQLNWESEDGNYVFADAQVEGQLAYRQNTQAATVSLENKFIAGEGLLTNIYLLFSQAQVSTHTQLNFDDEFNLTSHQLDIYLDEINQLSLQLKNVSQGDLAVKYAFKDLKLLKQHELDSYLEIVGINDLDIVGQSIGELKFINNKINSIDVSIKDVSFEIESKRTEALDLNAQLHWQATGTEQISNISWQNLLIAGMPIQESELQLLSVGEKMVITPESTVPVFDGSIIIHQLSLDKIFKPQIDIVFDGEVTPISLALITEKMNWPIMQGNISGKIPGMKKQGQSISFDGALDINVFDGKMRIEHLSMERLFGIAPVIAADVSFKQLNLKQITSTFDFGEITGLIDGTVKGLRITNWKADRLEASIESVARKKIKQTISQRAIDNISSIGGIQGALSRSFLRFFDSFKYKKIGIGCKLRNSICEMSGIKTADNTYKLIEGKGIPSINIIGFQKFIDWEVFLDRLLNAGY